MSTTTLAVSLLSIIAISGSLTAGMLLWARQRAYRHHLPYNRKQNYSYNFAKGSMEAVRVHCTPTGFALPELAHGALSAFLEIDVRATYAGELFDPYIEIEVPGLVGRQYLERGARGTRYLNLSRFLAVGMMPGNRVTLRGRHITWETKWCHLYLSHERLWPSEKVLIVAPHPDDAEIAAFGVYSSSSSTLVTIGAGDSAGRCLSGPWNESRLPASTIARLRTWDSITVPSIGGVSPMSSINLAYPDGRLAEMHMHHRGVHQEIRPAYDFPELRRTNLAPWMPTEPRNCSWESLVSDLVHVLRYIQPTVIVTPYPWHDPHPDHGFSTLAVCEALRIAELSAGRLYLYLNHYRTTELHPLGFAGSGVSLPPCFEENGIPCDALYSHALSEEDQRSKYFALEAMHDLRELSPVHSPKWIDIYRRVRSSIHACIHGLGLPPTSYFRRAIRPDELFFVLPFSKLEELVSNSQRMLDDTSEQARNQK